MRRKKRLMLFEEIVSNPSMLSFDPVVNEEDGIGYPSAEVPLPFCGSCKRILHRDATVCDRHPDELLLNLANREDFDSAFDQECKEYDELRYRWAVRFGVATFALLLAVAFSTEALAHAFGLVIDLTYLLGRDPLVVSIFAVPATVLGWAFGHSLYKRRYPYGHAFIRDALRAHRARD